MTDRSPALASDILAAIAAAQQPDAADAAALARVRSRVMERIAAEPKPGHVTVEPGGGKWHDFLPGIQRKVLHEKAGVMSYLLKFAPGAVLPAHRHPMDERCVVLQGSVRIGGQALAAGGFHLAQEGLPHADITSDEGGVIYLHGASPRAEHLISGPSR
jgi:quercetin dioxygenase-like cupin family protein